MSNSRASVNMDVHSETFVISNITHTKRRIVKFNKSPFMFTFLVAFVTGKLKSIRTGQFRFPIRLFATPNHDIENGQFALDLTARTLQFYERTFSYDYPLPKLDMVVKSSLLKLILLGGTSTKMMITLCDN